MQDTMKVSGVGNAFPIHIYGGHGSAITILIWQLCRTDKVFRIRAAGIVEEQTAKRPVLLADVEEI